MDLVGKTHTQYVAKYDPDSLTAAMNRSVNAPKGAPVPSATYVTGMGPPPKAEAKASGSKCDASQQGCDHNEVITAHRGE